MRLDATLIDVGGGHLHGLFVFEVCREQVLESDLSEMDKALLDMAGEPTATVSEQLRALAMMAQRLEEAAGEA